MRRHSAAARIAAAAIVVVVAGFAGGPARADGDDHDGHGKAAGEFAHGAPATPSEPWLLAAGGRIYDNWWDALDREEPEGTHPSYPAAGEQSGPDTWRCKECHGWDYRGAAGVFRKGSHFTGIKGINGAIGRPETEIAALLRAPLHGYTPEMITDDELARIAAFVSRGQVDMSTIVDGETRAIIAGDPERGRGVFQTVCAACHGFDGKLMDWGDDGEHAYVGTEATTVPDEVLNKILNAHTGVAMVNLRAFPPDVAVDVLSYTATLPAD